MDKREISKRVNQLQEYIQTAEENIAFGYIDPQLTRAHKELKQIQKKCIHNGDTFTVENEIFCTLCNKKLRK